MTPSPREQLAQVLDAVNSLVSIAKIAKSAGLTVKETANAVRGRSVGTVAHLRLCAATKCDPLPEIGHEVREPADFDFAFFAMAFKMRRWLSRHSLAEAGEAIGVQPRTITALEGGAAMPIGVVLRACVYLKIHPYAYFKVVRPACSRETFPQVAEITPYSA